MTHPAHQPPYGLPAVAFPHRALAALAARAPIGPARDVALAWLVCVRLLDGAFGPHPLADATRTARSAAAKTWLAGLGLPASMRLSFSRLIEACGGTAVPDRARLTRGFAELVRATASHLDPAARAELDAFAKVQSP